MTAGILSLPPELILSIISCLRLPDLAYLASLSTAFKDLFETNQSAIFRSAALVHGYIHPGIALSELEASFGKRIMRDVSSWYSLCKRYYLLNKAWSAKAPSTQNMYPATGNSITRFKVDEKRGFIACTSSKGGLVVTDIEDPSRALWSLSSDHVRMFAHVEYDNGFLAFDRVGNVKEIWKHVPDCLTEESEVMERALPDEEQLQAETWPSEDVDRPLEGDRRGHFRPYCLLLPPDTFHGHLNAYHLVYPYLISSGLRRAYIWDVRTGEVVQDLNLFQAIDDGPVLTLNQICYVEFSHRYAFIARMQGIQVFTRKDQKRGDGTLVTQIPTYKMCYGHRYYSLVSRNESLLDVDLERIAKESCMSMIPQTVHIEHKVVEEEDRQFLFDSPIALHVSPDGKHLFILLTKPHLVVIPFWEEVFLGSHPIPRRDISGTEGHLFLENVFMYGHYAHTIRLGSISSFSRYLAVEPEPSTDGKVRVAVATTGGLFVLNIAMPPTYESIPRTEGVDLRMDISLVGKNLLYRPDSNALKEVSCLQISPSGVWVNFPSKSDDDEHIKPAEFPPLSSYYDTLEDTPSYEEMVHPIQGYSLSLFRADLEDDNGDEEPENRTVWSVNF